MAVYASRVGLSLIALCIFLGVIHQCLGRRVKNKYDYQPNWPSLDSRPLPAWYDEAKVGIFMHWGVFSVPSFGSAWFWWRWKSQLLPPYVEFMKQNYPPGFTYADFAPQFTTEFYDPKTFAEIVQASGAK